MGCSPWDRKESDTTEQLNTVRPIPASVSREPSSHSLLLFPPQLPNVVFLFLRGVQALASLPPPFTPGCHRPNNKPL